MERWKKIAQGASINNLSTQTGGGASSSVKVISPQKALIERAKSALKTQINNANPFKRVQSYSTSKRKKSSPRKKRKTTTTTTKKRTTKKTKSKTKTKPVKRIKSKKRK